MREKKRLNKGAVHLIASLLLVSFFILPMASAFAGKVCGSASPCNCGTNCSGGNELFGNSQAYCDSNPIECFNTIDSCRDGTILSLNYVKDINITSLNGSLFRVGDTMEIDATLFSSSVNSEGVFFVYANATVNTSVNWSVVYSTTFAVSNQNYHLRYNYTIPNKIGDHTLRVIDIFYQVANITCGRDANADFPSYSDTDDITFTVLPQPAPQVNFTGPTPTNASTLTTITIIINVTHNETHPDTLILSFNGTNQSQSYSGGHTSITKTNLRQGNYSFYVWVNDTFGNVNQTETRSISISTPIDIVIESPSPAGSYASGNISLNVTAEATQENKNITWVAYTLNGNPNTTITAYRLNISADISDTGGVINESLTNVSNLSQSLTPSTTMRFQNISLKLQRTGFPNTTLSIREDAGNSPSATILGAASIDNSSVSSTSFAWISVRLNQSVTLQNNTRYWLFLDPNGTAEDHYDWESNDDGIFAQGALLQNSAHDALFRIFDTLKYRTTIVGSEGANTLLVYANNSDTVTVASSSIAFTVDTLPPAFGGIDVSQDPLEVGSSLTISIDVSDASSSVGTMLLEFNGTNNTMSLQEGGEYSRTFSPTLLGENAYRIYMNDSLGNANFTPSFTFTVADTAGPAFSSISTAPSTEEGLDPAVVVNVTATITDFGGVSTATLQYRNASASEWSNATMQNSSSLFFGNFTPSAGVWTYRILANDSSGNQNISANASLNSSFDYSWARTPSSFGALSGIKGAVVTVGNLTINNSGDFVLSFDITSSQAFVSFNKSTPFALSAYGYETIQVNATTPLTEAEYSVILTSDAQNATPYPDYLQKK